MRPEDEKTCEASKENICIFLVSGRTYSFKGVYDVVDNENCISFSYRAMSDGKVKSGVFYKYNGAIAGVSRF